MKLMRNNPFRRLKYLPWAILAQVAGLTIFSVVVLEILLLVSTEIPAIARSLDLLFAPPLGLLMGLAIAMGVGALGVCILERFYSQVTINTSVLWALILCLLIGLLVHSLLPFVGLIGLNQAALMGILLGVFIKGWSYWRRY